MKLGLILFVILLLGVWVWIAAEREAEIAAERDLCARGDVASCYVWNVYNRELGKPHVCGLNPGVRRLQSCASDEKTAEMLKEARDLSREVRDQTERWEAAETARNSDAYLKYEAQKRENPTLTIREYYEARHKEYSRRSAEWRREHASRQ